MFVRCHKCKRLLLVPRDSWLGALWIGFHPQQDIAWVCSSCAKEKK